MSVADEATLCAEVIIVEAGSGGAVNVSLRRRLQRARARERAALPWHEWLEAVEPEVVATLKEIARNKRAPVRERERCRELLKRYYGVSGT